jgi:hypothetical protein
LSGAGLWRLRGWLEEHREQAIARYGRTRATGLSANVRVLAWLTRLSSLRRDEAPVPDGPGEARGGLPASGTGYTRTARAIDIMMPFKVEMLRRRPGYVSERALARALGMKRSTLRGMLACMDEAGFSLEKNYGFDKLAEIAGAGPRGRRKTEDRPQT